MDSPLLLNIGGPIVPIIFLSFIILPIAWLLHTYWRLSHIPGPLWSRLSDIPRLLWARSDHIHEKHIALHRKYGVVVRLGPNCVSIGTPSAIPAIYGTGTNLQKSDFYRVLQPLAHGRVVQGLFNTQDEALHRALKRPIAGIYSMTNLVSFEPYVDTTIRIFLQRMEEQQAKQQTVNLGAWLQFFAFDVMGEITFSRRFGFLDTASDVDGIIDSIYRFFSYGSVIGQMPVLDRLWAKNPLINRFLPSKNSSVVAFAVARANERQAASEKGTVTDDYEYNSRDFMSRFLETRQKDPSLPPGFLTAWTTSNVQAGSDTTAILLRAIVHFLLTHPVSLAKLRRELATARAEGRLSDVVTWKESRDLSYLDACIKEAGRLHSPVGLAMERVVAAPQGMEVCGTHLPKGTVVGLNPWVVHRDKRIFGEDADEWNPDRWLRPKDEQRAAMERSLLTFGAGHRTCLGKNISYLEIYKLIPTLFARYDITFETPDEWKLVNHWLVFQEGFNVTVRIHDEKKDVEK